MNSVSRKRLPWVILGFALLCLPTLLWAAGDGADPGSGDNAALQTDGWGKGLGYIGAALAVGLGSIGAGLAVGPAASAAVGAAAENAETAGKSFIFVGVAEGVAIYGLVIAIMILTKL